MPKNTFFEGTKKFSVQKNFWDFLYMYKGGLCKKNTAHNSKFYNSKVVLHPHQKVSGINGLSKLNKCLLEKMTSCM